LIVDPTKESNLPHSPLLRVLALFSPP
jgi:hypothetical protein